MNKNTNQSNLGNLGNLGNQGEFMVSSIRQRYDYVIFKMQQYIFVTGGFNANSQSLTSCVYFDLVLKNWFTFNHSLPYALANASVVVSKDETFAIITGGRVNPDSPEEKYSDDVILFTQDSGFHVLEISKSITKRAFHVSIALP